MKKKTRNEDNFPKYNPRKCPKCGNPLTSFNGLLGRGCQRCTFVSKL